LQFFTTFLGNGGTLEQIGGLLLGSQEYFDLHGSSNDAFLTALYQDVLGRLPDPGGLAAFGQALASGMPRSQLAGLLLTSTEYRSDVVQGVFQSVLGRPADAATVSFFVGELQHGGTDQLVLAQVLGSGEAFARRPSR